MFDIRFIIKLFVDDIILYIIVDNLVIVSKILNSDFDKIYKWFN